MHTKPITVTVKDAEIFAFQRAVARSGGKVINSGPSAGGYTVTYVEELGR